MDPISTGDGKQEAEKEMQLLLSSYLSVSNFIYTTYQPWEMLVIISTTACVTD